MTLILLSLVLRMLAMNYSALPSTLRSRMKMSAFFLGTKRLRTESSTTSKTLLDEDSDDEDGGTTTLVYQLSRASDLAVNDDPQGEFPAIDPGFSADPSSRSLPRLPV